MAAVLPFILRHKRMFDTRMTLYAGIGPVADIGEWPLSGRQFRLSLDTCMPFTAELRIPVGGRCLELLNQSRAIRVAIERATEWDGKLQIDVLPQLLLTNVYGRSCFQDECEIALWASSPSEVLFVEQDFTNPTHQSLIGEWNLPFLRWLKSISTTTQERLIVDYDHERGDTPYEYVWWVCSPVSETDPYETFGLASHGGMDEAEWELEILRFADGRTEVKENGQCDEPPRYL